jgi:glucose/arabinose dehydrogenase
MPPRLHIALALFALVLLAPNVALSQSGNASAHLVHDSLEFPGTIRFAPDGRLFYLEVYGGRVMVYHDSLSAQPSVWATIPVEASGERGLLGLAFHPQFPDSPFVYLYHTNPAPLFNRVVRMRDSAGVGVQYTILLDSLSALSASHESGRLAFGPDRMLYVTVGDQDIANPQNLASPLGKILRLTTTGRPAPGNPFGPLNPVVAYGIRNSYGLCFDSVTGQGYFTENGPLCDDELNYFQFAANYGWGPNDSCGTQPAGTKLPMWTISPTVAPTGVCAYRGNALPYDGNLFFGTWNERQVLRVVLARNRPDIADSVQAFLQFTERVVDVTEGRDQCLWVATETQIWRVGPSPAPLAVPPVSSARAWTLGPNPFRGRVALALTGGAAIRKLDIFDLLGRRVRSFQGPIPSAAAWDGTDAARHALPAGIFLVRAETPTGYQTHRLIRLTP